MTEQSDYSKYHTEDWGQQATFRGDPILGSMDDLFKTVSQRIPAWCLVRVIVVQGIPMHWSQNILFKVGCWFLKRSGLDVGIR